jgi:hypothetical protein
MKGYYFVIEKSEKNALTFAYIYRTGESHLTTPPVKEFHSIRNDARRRMAKRAFKWIDERADN